MAKSVLFKFVIAGFLCYCNSNATAETLEKILYNISELQKNALELQKNCKEITRECYTKSEKIISERNNYYSKIHSITVSFECVVVSNTPSQELKTIECKNSQGIIYISNQSRNCSGWTLFNAPKVGNINICFFEKIFPKDTIQVEAQIGHILDCVRDGMIPSTSNTYSCDPKNIPIITVGGYVNEQDLGPVKIKVK